MSVMLTTEGWSRELRKDRRAIARLLADIPADAVERGRRMWKLETVIRALDANVGGAQPRSLDPSRAAVEKAFNNLEAGFQRLRRLRSIEARRGLLREIGPLVGAFINALDGDALRDPPDQCAVVGIVRQHLQRQALAEFAALLDAKFTDRGLVANTRDGRG